MFTRGEKNNYIPKIIQNKALICKKGGNLISFFNQSFFFQSTTRLMEKRE